MILLIRNLDRRRTHCRSLFYSRNALLALSWSPHDVDGENAALMTGEKIIDEIADDGVRLVAELRHHSTNQGVAAPVPFQIDRPVKIARAMDFRPTVGAARLLGPGFDETKFLFQLRIPRDLTAQRSAPSRDHLDDGLHR
jgi:hypothetical protein